MTSLTPEGQKQLVVTINEAVDHLVLAGDLITESLGILKCKQLQMIAVDLASISDHIQDLAVNGPAEPWPEIPLEQSETTEAV
jgi:hypothetical protein